MVSTRGPSGKLDHEPKAPFFPAASRTLYGVRGYAVISAALSVVAYSLV